MNSLKYPFKETFLFTIGVFQKNIYIQKKTQKAIGGDITLEV